MPDVIQLVSYPFVVVRVACRRCPRTGKYRLARLAARYGADIGLRDLLGEIAGDCELWGHRCPMTDQCGVYYPDLVAPKPPDLPPRAAPPRQLRLVTSRE